VSAGIAPLIFLIAGETSGDVLGGRLMAALKDLSGGTVRFCGIGGETMTAQGLHSLFPMEELTLMGILGGGAPFAEAVVADDTDRIHYPCLATRLWW
jgi:hypothetical protein